MVHKIGLMVWTIGSNHARVLDSLEEVDFMVFTMKTLKEKLNNINF